MAIINKTGITDGTTIQAEHVTRAIDALSGGSTDSVVATGSFKGNLDGTATTAQTINTVNSTTNYEFFPTFVDADNGSASPEAVYTDAGIRYNPSTNILTTTASYAVTASFATQALSASYAANVPATASYALAALSSSYAVTASYALNAGGGAGFPFTGSAQVTGSMGITGSLNVTGGVTASLFGTASVAIRTRDEFITLNFTHREITDTTLGTTRYFGGFSLPTNSTVGRIGLAAPFDCTIVSSSITIYNSSFSGAGQVDYSLYVKGNLVAPLSSTIDLDDFIKDEAFAVQAVGGPVSATSGDLLTIRLRELADSTGGYQTHVALLLKKL